MPKNLCAYLMVLVEGNNLESLHSQKTYGTALLTLAEVNLFQVYLFKVYPKPLAQL